MTVRSYTDSDYEHVKALYLDSSTFGGQFDKSRDSQEKLKRLITQKPDVILVAEENGEITGTVTLFEDGRAAWLYRFAIKTDAVAQELFSKAAEILKSKGHSQVLVYAPAQNTTFESRYLSLGFEKGNDFTAYWKNI